jgi:hypothetical protein
VPQQLPDFPQRAAGDRGVEPGPFGRRGEQGAVGVQLSDVLLGFHHAIVSVRRAARLNIGARFGRQLLVRQSLLLARAPAGGR